MKELKRQSELDQAICSIMVSLGSALRRLTILFALCLKIVAAIIIVNLGVV